jgi:hypothetical protein
MSFAKPRSVRTWKQFDATPSLNGVFSVPGDRMNFHHYRYPVSGLPRVLRCQIGPSRVRHSNRKANRRHGSPAVLRQAHIVERLVKDERSHLDKYHLCIVVMD